MRKKKIKKDSIPIKENLHIKIMATLMIICVFGCLMVFSASSYTCAQKEMYNYDSMYMLKKQAIFMLSGFGIIFLSLFVNLALLIEKLAVPIYCAGYISTFLLLTLNVLPNTGIGLPFISYGGTSILCLMFEMAMACSIAKKNYVKSVKKEMRRRDSWK